MLIREFSRPVAEWHRNGDTISTDPNRLDRATIHGFLTSSYWATGVSLETVQRSIEHSLAFGLFRGAEQIGFARVVTDYATVGYLADVFVLPTYRGRGLAKWLVMTALDHPALRELRGWHLRTRDAHGLYHQFGFVTDTVSFMRRPQTRQGEPS